MLTLLKRWTAALLIGFAGPAALAEAPMPAGTAPVEAAANPAIWTIEKPNGKTITLFGTVHILPKDLGWRTTALTEALAAAEVLVLETPIADAMTNTDLQAFLMQNMMNPPGVTLSTLLKPDEKAAVEKAASAVGAPFAAMEPLRPWAAALQLTVAFAVKSGFDINSGVDRQLEAEAKTAGKELGYFETAEEQLAIFIKLTSEQEIALLVSGAEDIAKDAGMLHELVNAWARGETAAIDDLMNGSLEAMPELAKALLEDRNARWVEKIAGSYMGDDKSYVIAVGAAHLAGAKSVQAMLRAKGVTVEGP